jgi:hypothetical protein
VNILAAGNRPQEKNVMKKRNVLEVSAIIVRCAMAALIAFLLLGVGKCDVNDKADIIKLHPEFKGLIDKFDMEKSGNQIVLTTYDNLSFHKAIEKLKKTPMNIPLDIAYYDNDGNIGVFEMEIGLKNIKNYEAVFRYYDGKQPFKGIIWLRSGLWESLEINAPSVSGEPDAERTVFLKELKYANKKVIKINNLDYKKRNHVLFQSKLDSTPNTNYAKGDGATKDRMESEFNE